MNKKYDVVIIGGGGHGLSLAYNLAKDTNIKIAIIEKNYLGSGASGRNGESIRSTFGCEAWIRFYDESLRIWENISRELSFNVMFTRCGYLILATSKQKMSMIENVYKIQQKMGVNSSLVNKAKIMKMMPYLNSDIIIGGIFQSDGGYARHDAVIWAYLKAATRSGVDIFPFTEVTSIDHINGRITGLQTTKGKFETPLIVNAAGGHCKHISSMVGIDLPLKTYRFEMIATEPLKPFLKQYLSAPDQLGYMHQTARGEFIGGTEPPGVKPAMDLRCTIMALKNMARKFIELFPCLEGAKVMRQWGGLIPITDDQSPIIGPVSEVEGFILDCGYSYGYMGIPAGGKFLADFIKTGNMPSVIKPFSFDRFKKGGLIHEPSLSI